MDFFCVRQGSLDAVLRNAHSHDVFAARNIATLRTSVAGGTPTLGVAETALDRFAEAHHAEVVRTPIPFPPRMRWGQDRQHDQLILLSLAPGLISSAPELAQLVQEWVTLHNMPLHIVHADGGVVPPAPNDQMTLVLYGSPEPVERPDPTVGWRGAEMSGAFIGPASLNFPNFGALFHERFPTLRRIGNTVYCPYGLITATVSNLTLVRHILNLLSPDLSLLSPEARLNHSRRQLARVRPQGLLNLETQIERLTHETTRLEERVQASLQALTDKEASVRRMIRQSMTIESSDVAARMYREQFDQIAQIDLVEDIEVLENLSLRIRTKPLVITNPSNGNRHLAGSYEILFHPPSTTTRMPQIRNLTRLIGGSHHPHCRPNPCWGNMSEFAPPLLARGDYAATLLLVLAYLQTINPVDPWGQTVRDWPRA